MALSFYEFLRALLYGIIEGITEWLPVSSTGHLIITEGITILSVGSYLPEPLRTEFCELFNVVVQLGAIMAVVLRCRGRLFGGIIPNRRSDCHQERTETLKLWYKLGAATLPAAVLGILLNTVTEILFGRDADSLLYNPEIVAATLIIYGVIFMMIEHGNLLTAPRIFNISDIGFRRAFIIGIAQALSLIPGTSRSGSTVIGARLAGVSRTAATEFSFLMAVPAIGGASLLKLAKFLHFIHSSEAALPLTAIITLIIAAITAFLVSRLTIDLLLSFVARHTFGVFGIYRIALGIAVLLLCIR